MSTRHFTTFCDRNVFEALLELSHAWMFCIRCMRFSGCIKSHQNSRQAHYSKTTKCDPNGRSASHTHKCERYWTFCVQWCNVFKDCRMNCRYLCVCFATMILLLYLFYFIIQRLLSLHDSSVPICHALPQVAMPCISIFVSDHNIPCMLLYLYSCLATSSLA